MKNRLFILFVFFAASCSDGSEISTSIDLPEPIPTESFEPIMNNKTPDLERKVFEIGNKGHFVKDSCSFYFECDCCFANIYFNSNKTFYVHDFCVEEESYSHGQFQIYGDTVILNYSGYWTSTIYNEARQENDSISPKFFYKDTIIPSFTKKFLSKKCGQNSVLIQTNGEEFAVETKGSYKKCIGVMEKIGEIRKLDSLKHCVPGL